jgi:hypothetical protein
MSEHCNLVDKAPLSEGPSRNHTVSVTDVKSLHRHAGCARNELMRLD